MEETLETDVVVTGETAAPEPAPEPSIREELSQAYDKGTPEPEPAAPKVDPTPKVDPAATPVPGDKTTLDEPPARLKDRFGQTWATLPPEVKQSFREYESAIGRLGNRYGQAAQQWNQMQTIFAPYEAMVKSEGGTLPKAVQNLLETARVLRQGHPEQRTALVMQMLPTFKIPHQRLEDGRIVLSPPTSDPALLNRISQLEGSRLTDEARIAHNQRQQVDSELEAFVADPAHPYTQLPGYLDSMAVLIESRKATGLEDAYKQAAWLHEESRTLELAKRTQEDLTRRGSQALAARSAAVSVPGNAPGPVTRSTKNLSLRDELAARMDGTLE